MKLIKYENPATPMDRLFDRLNWGLPAIDRFFGENDTTGDGWASIRMPRTNVQELEDSFVFTLEMPGLDKKDVSLNIEGDTLVVKGETTQKDEQNDKGLIRREYRSARFERSFNVNGIHRDGVKARMESGILTITLPKTAEKVGKKIDIA
jgi:HSP20 family protein